jgi:hypothetical protein
MFDDPKPEDTVWNGVSGDGSQRCTVAEFNAKTEEEKRAFGGATWPPPDWKEPVED